MEIPDDPIENELETIFKKNDKMFIIWQNKNVTPSR